MKATTSSFVSARDHNPSLGDLDYYGMLTRIIELTYGNNKHFVLFNCEWVKKGKRLLQDKDGFLLANFTGVQPHKELFILASQVLQVLYIEDANN